MRPYMEVQAKLPYLTGPDPVWAHPYFDGLDPFVVARFKAFHEANPQVLYVLADFAREIKRSGRAEFGIKALMERLRWYSAIERQDSTFKVNNNYASAYARLLSLTFPELDGMFEFRAKHGD